MNEQKLILKINAHNLNVLHRDLNVAHLSGHFLVLPTLTWIGPITDRTERTVRDRCAVSLVSAGHMKALHAALKALALTRGSQVNTIALF